MILLRLYLEFAKVGLFAVGGGLACAASATCLMTKQKPN